MDEQKTTKTSKAQLQAKYKYRREKCIKKEIMFYPDDLSLLEKAEDKASGQKKSFTKYVKDLIHDDVN